MPPKAGCASVLYWICIWSIGWPTQSENSGLAVVIRYVAQDSSSIFFTCGYCIWSFLEDTDSVIANECFCSVALETNMTVIVLWNVFSLSYKFIFLNKKHG